MINIKAYKTCGLLGELEKNIINQIHVLYKLNEDIDDIRSSLLCPEEED